MIRCTRTWRLAAAALGSLLLAGCMSAPPVPDDHFYRLPPAQVTALPAPLFKGVLAVDRPRSDDLHGERAMLFVRAERPLELNRYHYYFWVDTPPHLIQEQLRLTLQSAGVAARVVRADGGPAPDVVLRSRLVRFERVLRKGGAYASVALEFSVARANGEPGWSKAYADVEPAQGDDVHATVQAFGVALQRIYGRLLHDLASR